MLTKKHQMIKQYKEWLRGFQNKAKYYDAPLYSNTHINRLLIWTVASPPYLTITDFMTQIRHLKAEFRD